MRSLNSCIHSRAATTTTAATVLILTIKATGIVASQMEKNAIKGQEEERNESVKKEKYPKAALTPF